MPGPAALGLVAWVCCALLGFWLAIRVRPGKEQTGRLFVGVGALMMAVSTGVPAGGPYAPPALLCEILIALAGVFLLAGLFLSYPNEGLRSFRRTPDRDEAPDAAQDDTDEDQP